MEDCQEILDKKLIHHSILNNVLGALSFGMYNGHIVIKNVETYNQYNKCINDKRYKILSQYIVERR